MQQFFLITTVIASTVAVGLVWLNRKRNKRKCPTEWKPVGKVKNLCIYPLKGGHRMELTTARCTGYGLKVFTKGTYQFYDRNLIVYKEHTNEYISSSTFPKLLLIKVETSEEDTFALSAPGMPEITVKVPGKDAKADNVSVWQGAKIFKLDCGDEIAQWLSRYIYEKDSGLRLGFHDGRHRRNIYDNSYLKQYCDIYPILTNEATGMYAFLCSYSLINETSVNELKKKISNEEEKVGVHNFRGNIIIEDFEGRPYVEDSWNWIKIGDAVFYIVKPNTRCAITNMDPNTSIRSKRFEPMTTLKTYRQLKTLKNIDFEGEDPVMGCYMGLHKEGIISVEDTVCVGE